MHKEVFKKITRMTNIKSNGAMRKSIFK